MDENELKEKLDKAETYMEDMNDQERETYLRALFMNNFSNFEVIGTKHFEGDSTFIYLKDKRKKE